MYSFRMMENEIGCCKIAYVEREDGESPDINLEQKMKETWPQHRPEPSFPTEYEREED